MNILIDEGTKLTYDPTAIVKFLFNVMQWGGLGLAGVGALIFVLAKKNNNDDLSTNAIWIVLAGVAAAAIGGYLNTQKLPTL